MNCETLTPLILQAGWELSADSLSDLLSISEVILEFCAGLPRYNVT
jgi:hypothetical protein